MQPTFATLEDVFTSLGDQPTYLSVALATHAKSFLRKATTDASPPYRGPLADVRPLVVGSSSLQPDPPVVHIDANDPCVSRLRAMVTRRTPDDAMLHVRRWRVALDGLPPPPPLPTSTLSSAGGSDVDMVGAGSRGGDRTEFSETLSEMSVDTLPVSSVVGAPAAAAAATAAPPTLASPPKNKQSSTTPAPTPARNKPAPPRKLAVSSTKPMPMLTASASSATKKKRRNGSSSSLVAVLEFDDYNPDADYESRPSDEDDDASSLSECSDDDGPDEDWAAEIENARYDDDDDDDDLDEDPALPTLGSLKNMLGGAKKSKPPAAPFVAPVASSAKPARSRKPAATSKQGKATATTSKAHRNDDLCAPSSEEMRSLVEHVVRTASTTSDATGTASAPPPQPRFLEEKRREALTELIPKLRKRWSEARATALQKATSSQRIATVTQRYATLDAMLTLLAPAPPQRLHSALEAHVVHRTDAQRKADHARIGEQEVARWKTRDDSLLPWKRQTDSRELLEWVVCGGGVTDASVGGRGEHNELSAWLLDAASLYMHPIRSIAVMLKRHCDSAGMTSLGALDERSLQRVVDDVTSQLFERYVRCTRATAQFYRELGRAPRKPSTGTRRQQTTPNGAKRRVVQPPQQQQQQDEADEEEESIEEVVEDS